MMGMIGVPANIDHHIPIQHVQIFLKQTGHKQEMYTPTCISSPIVAEQVDGVKLTSRKERSASVTFLFEGTILFR